MQFTYVIKGAHLSKTRRNQKQLRILEKKRSYYLLHVYKGYKFFNFWNEIKFLGLLVMNFYILSTFGLIFYSATKKSWRTQYAENFHIFARF